MMLPPAADEVDVLSLLPLLMSVMLHFNVMLEATMILRFTQDADASSEDTTLRRLVSR